MTTPNPTILRDVVILPPGADQIRAVDAALDRFGYDRSIFERTWRGFSRRGDDTKRRADVWDFLYHDRSMSFPKIARACGMPDHCHPTIVMALQRRSAARAGKA